MQPNGVKPFQVVGEGQGAIWSVNSTPGGDSTVGTIDDQGTYTAPAQVPEESRTVSVSATVGSQTAGASLDILDKEALFTSVSIVQSVVYLGSLQNLYTAELSILSGSGSGSQPAAVDPAQGSTDSEIFTVPSGFAKQTLAQFPNEEISKMISFTASDDNEYLLLAAKTSGKIIRLDPSNGSTTDVATDLNQPTALVLDKNSGDLVVAESTQISTVPADALNTGLAAQAFPASSTRQPTESFPTPGANSGIVVDDCTGNFYISDSAAGVVRRFNTDTEELDDLFPGLNQPGQLVGLFRRGVSCPDAFQMLVAETGADQLTLLTPSRQLRTAWIAALDPIDVTFLPGGTDFASTSAILFTESVAGGSQQSGSGTQSSTVGVPGLYDTVPINAPSDIAPPPTTGTEPPEPPGGPSGSITTQSASFHQMPPLVFLLMFAVAVFAVVVLRKKEEE